MEFMVVGWEIISNRRGSLRFDQGFIRSFKQQSCVAMVIKDGWEIPLEVRNEVT
jgi:hypothetical protein